MLNEILQYIAVGIILLLCIAWAIKRIRNRQRKEDCSEDVSCNDCALKQHCRKK